MELEFLKYKDNIHLVTMATRPGAYALISSIEWFWFSPKKNLNHLFNLAIVRWEGLDWLVVSIPKYKLQAVKKLAKQLGMRIADGVPTMIQASGMSTFPGGEINGQSNRDMFTIENDAGSPIYSNSTKTHQDIKSAESEIVDGFINGVEWTPEKIVEYIYGVPNFVADPNFVKE